MGAVIAVAGLIALTFPISLPWAFIENLPDILSACGGWIEDIFSSVSIW